MSLNKIVLAFTIGICVWADCAYSQKNEEADSPLWIAVQDQNYSLAKKLLDDGANPNAHTRYHGSPLFLAVGNDDTMMVLLLLHHHASMYDTSTLIGSLGGDAIRSNALHSLEILYHNGYSLTARDRQPPGWSLIKDAVMDNSYQGVEFLLQHGVSSNDADSFGMSVLTEACQRGDTSIVSLLLKSGADPNGPESSGFYPIDY
ncbi:MAG TPA: ankyrin repeat domain-containing protein, partial [Candidatus Kapabacteria bacterium]